VTWEANGTLISVYFSFKYVSADGVTGNYFEWSRELQEREAAAKHSKDEENKKAL